MVLRRGGCEGAPAGAQRPRVAQGRTAAFTLAAVASLETLLNLQAVDKLDPREVAMNVAAMAIVSWVVAELPSKLPR